MENPFISLLELAKQFNVDIIGICGALTALGFKVSINPNEQVTSFTVPLLESYFSNSTPEQREEDNAKFLAEQGDSQTVLQKEEPVEKEMEIKEVTDELRASVAKIIAGIQDTEIPGKKGTWVLMAKISEALKSEMIDFRTYGFERLKSFLEDNPHLTIETDFGPKVPRHFVQSDLASKSRKVAEKKTSAQPQTPEDSAAAPLTSTSPIYFLGERTEVSMLNWAWIGERHEVIEKLKGIALPEDWRMTEKNGVAYYPILDNYLLKMFIKVYRDRGISCSISQRYAVFNTGLVDRKYKDIYMLFEASSNETDHFPWHFIDFCVEGEERAGKILVSEFKQLPKRAKFFTDKSDLLFDADLGAPALDTHHIIVENIDRLPFDFIKTNAPKDFELMSPEELEENTKAMGEWDKKEFLNNYYEALRDAVNSDPRSLRHMSSDLEDALEVAMKRAGWNYKSAIPMYWIKGNKMCLFLPLCLVDDSKADVALVVNKTPSGRYQGETIYTLEWAYKCARLVCRPDSDWLTLDSIPCGKGIDLGLEDQ